ncbi:Oidioi.mRNA.OKI2018_I69.chr1.g3121.t1.cds [Oikopleura dioica]|uniref:Pre-mRNA-splicing regulator WTAP n=1 Tax=Oikopleura dioica TaxID=34765 RepID=A0ABN7ST75_OIKDI|nr:Oidioi.mRNA.OKI2018_I69.chr1.g3121.t1.cds [Oikopleura dioica]
MTVADRGEDRPRLTERDFDSMSRNELWQAYQQLESYLHDVDEKEEAMKKQLTEAQRRENVLVLRLSAREQELQDVAAVAVNYKKLQAQTPTLRKTMLDPAINYMYQKMRTELKETKEKLDLAQSELAACKFTPDSQTGKKLMSRCRTLIQENQDLGSQLSTGETKQLETRIAQQDKQIAELKKNQIESEKFVLSLDDETEGLQAQIMTLKSKLDHANKRCEKLEKEIRGDKDEPKKEGDGTETHYFTPEQLKAYYQNLINTGYMTDEQAKVALEQAESQINEDGQVPVTFAASSESKSDS